MFVCKMRHLVLAGGSKVRLWALAAKVYLGSPDFLGPRRDKTACGGLGKQVSLSSSWEGARGFL
jgi:hypothetical protein